MLKIDKKQEIIVLSWGGEAGGERQGLVQVGAAAAALLCSSVVRTVGPPAEVWETET